MTFETMNNQREIRSISLTSTKNNIKYSFHMKLNNANLLRNQFVWLVLLGSILLCFCFVCCSFDRLSELSLPLWKYKSGRTFVRLSLKWTNIVVCRRDGFVADNLTDIISKGWRIARQTIDQGSRIQNVIIYCYVIFLDENRNFLFTYDENMKARRNLSFIF